MPKCGRRNERAELDYQVAPDTFMADAPFGNLLTPETIHMRLVGGKYVPTIDQPPRIKDEYSTRGRVHQLDHITVPPQQIDPRTSLDQDYYKDSQPTALINRRPDSKDIARLQYKTLPPIQQNRVRNDMTTVFEPEHWTHNTQPTLARETEYKQNYNPALDDDQMEMASQRPASVATVSDEEKRELFKTLPSNVMLPVDAIKLTREQEQTACKLTCKDLQTFNPAELRDVYLECSQHDRNLEGYTSLEVLDNALRRHRAYLSNTLRIIAAQFVSPQQRGKVNYEKVLSFINSALDMQKKGQLGHEKPKFYMQNGDSVKTGSIYKDREVAKLLRMVEHELSKSTYSFDWTRLENMFYQKDRDHRKTLSGPQIKDILYDCNLPLSDSLQNQILCLCEDNNRDGQYRWQAFLDFLYRVRPSNTGLPIPVSKRPLEYAKQFPAPVANWPRTDADAMERKEPNSPRREPSPRRGEYYKQDQRQNNYDERGLSPQRIMPPSRDQREQQEKVDLSDRGANDRDSPTDQYRPAYAKVDEYNWPPSPIRGHACVPAVPGDLGIGQGAYRDSKHDPSGGYKPSWQDKDRQSQISSPSRKGTPASDKDRQFAPMSPNRRARPRAPWASHYEQEPYQTDMSNPDRDSRDYNNYQAQGRFYRPKSYVEPQRSKSPRDVTRRLRPQSYREDYRGKLQELEFDRPKSRLRSPAKRARSLSPIRHASPTPGQQYTNAFRQIPSPYKLLSRNPSYQHGQDQNNPGLDREQPEQQHAYKRGKQQQYQKTYRLKAPYAESNNKEGSYQDSYKDKLQRFQDYYQRHQQQQPRYPHVDQNTYEDPSKDRIPNGFQEADATRYEQQQYPQGQYPGNGYRPRDDRRTDRRDDRVTHPQDREDKIRQLSNELHHLESKYKFTKDSIQSNEKPWLQRYLKLAEALYNSDIHNTGCLPRTDVIDVVRQYNDAFNLKLDMTRANMLAISPENVDKSGHILLKPFLASLCGDNFKYRT